MVAQLSTSEAQTQLGRFIRRSTLIRVLGLLCLLLPVTTVWAQGSGWQRPTAVEQRIDPLSAIDQQFMANQRRDVEALANRLGRRLTGNADRDIETLQTLLDRNFVARDDQLTLQAMGIVFGDLLGDTLDMDWVVYRDRAGRSRALRYRNSDTFLFPVTMISRRFEAGSERSLRALFDQVVADTRPRLPGANWR